MRFMIIVKATKETEAESTDVGLAPDDKLLSGIICRLEASSCGS